MTTYVDESVRVADGGLYLMAAAVVVSGDENKARHALRAALLHGQPRFHWRDEQERQRSRMLAVIAELGVTILGYALRPIPRRQDRARALCLKALAWDLRGRNELEVVIESREAHNDSKDARTIEQARRAGAAPSKLSYRFDRPSGEPLLWVPDAVAGALGAHLADGDSRYLDQLPAEAVALHNVDP